MHYFTGVLYKQFIHLFLPYEVLFVVFLVLTKTCDAFLYHYMEPYGRLIHYTPYCIFVFYWYDGNRGKSNLLIIY